MQKKRPQVQKKKHAPLTPTRPLPGDAAPWGVIHTVATRGRNESHSRGKGGPVRNLFLFQRVNKRWAEHFFPTPMPKPPGGPLDAPPERSEASVPVSQKKILVPRWMSSSGASTPCELISTSEVCGRFYRLLTDVSQVLIWLPPPLHIYVLLQKYSNYVPLLVWDGFVFVNLTLGCYSFRCG